LNDLQKNQSWFVRAKAAQLLSGHPKVGVPEGLLRAIEYDPDLHVVRDANRSWENITGHRSPDVFGFAEHLESWWKEHGPETTKKLEKLDCEMK
jgi:hypothetical protein